MLARLSDVRSKLKMTATDRDADLLRLIEEVSAQAAGLCWRDPDVGLGRQTNVTEYPYEPGACTASSAYLRLWPIERVRSVVQLFVSGTDEDFDAEAEENALELNVDYAIFHPQGRLHRINSLWTVGVRTLRVIYDGGYLDPNTEVDPWETATEYSEGDLVTQSGRTYAAIEDHTSSAESQPGIAAAWADTWAWVNTVPLDLQGGVELEVIRRFQTDGEAGLSGVSHGRGGSATLETDVHPRLVAACNRLRRYRVS